MWRFEDLKTSQDSSVLWLVVCCHFVIPNQFWRLIAFYFYFLGILNLLRVMLLPLVRRDWQSPWVWKTRSQSFGRQLVIWLSILPVWGMWFLITLPLPSTHLEPQHDRLAGNNLKIWRNKRPEDSTVRQTKLVAAKNPGFSQGGTLSTRQRECNWREGRYCTNFIFKIECNQENKL